MNTQHRGDLLYLYLAGTLDGSERDEVEEWIATGAPDALEELARAEQDLALLAAAQPPRAPRPDVRARLRARIASDLGETSAPAATPLRAIRSAPAWRPLLAAGLGGMLLAGAIAFGAFERASREWEAQQAAVASEVDTLRTEIEDLQGERDELDAEVADNEARVRDLETQLAVATKTIGVLHAEHAESVDLAGTDKAPGARGRIFWDWDEWYCYARVAGLEHDPALVYGVWLFTEDGVIGVGTFHTDAEGRATFLGTVPEDVGHVLRAGVSIEPDEALGVKPRGDVVLFGEVDPAKG